MSTEMQLILGVLILLGVSYIIGVVIIVFIQCVLAHSCRPDAPAAR